MKIKTITGITLTLFLILSVFIPFLAQVKGQSIAVFDDPVEDGYIIFDQGNYVRYDYYHNVIFGRYNIAIPSASVVEARGYIEWDISNLSDNVIITSVMFEYSGNQVYEYDANIMEMTVQPSTSADSVVFNNIPNGKKYVGPTGIPYAAGGPYQVDLGDSAKSDLQSKLQSGINWFAIGFYVTNIDKNNWNGIWSEESVGIDFPPYPPTISPTIHVEYTTPTEVPEFSINFLVITSIIMVFYIVIKKRFGNVSNVNA